MRLKSHFIYLLIIITTLLIFRFKTSSLPYTLLVDHLKPNDSFKVALYYSDISLSHTRAFSLSPQGITPIFKNFIAYSEGFLPRIYLNKLVSTINTFRKSNALSPLKSLYYYYEDDTTIFLCFSGGLENIYSINKEDFSISPLHYKSNDNREAMYVSSIKRIGSKFILLAGEANAYSSLIYHVDAHTFEVTIASEIETHPLAISSLNYTLNSSGNALFINDTMLKSFSPSQKTSYIPLPFNVQYILSSENNSIAFAINASTLTYAVLTPENKILREGYLSLPSYSNELVSGYFSHNRLYLLLYDPYYAVYKNYLALYNLSTEKLIYCIGLKPFSELAPLKIEPLLH